MEDNMLNSWRAMARVQNIQHIELEETKKKANKDLKRSSFEWDSSKREMKANKLQWQQALGDFLKALQEALKEVPK
jgi:hypothetical protein